MGRPKQSRSLRSYRRVAGRRQPRQCLLVVCEGEKTEPAYFTELRREWRLSTFEVEITDSGSYGTGAAGVVKCAIALRRRREADVRRGGEALRYDSVWCVFDAESRRETAAFRQAVQIAEKAGMRLAVSNPAFEYWLLLHFITTTKPFANAGEVVRELRRYMPHYQKNLDVTDSLITRTPEAISRARTCLQQRSGESDEFPNPCTLVYELVEALQAMALRGSPGT